MRAWLYILAGLLIWALHFAGIYAFVSLAAQTPAADDDAWQTASLAFSAGCLLTTGAALLIAVRRSRTRQALIDHVAALGALVGGVAIFWQAAAPMFGGG